MAFIIVGNNIDTENPFRVGIRNACRYCCELPYVRTMNHPVGQRPTPLHGKGITVLANETKIPLPWTWRFVNRRGDGVVHREYICVNVVSNGESA